MAPLPSRAGQDRCPTMAERVRARAIRQARPPRRRRSRRAASSVRKQARVVPGTAVSRCDPSRRRTMKDSPAVVKPLRCQEMAARFLEIEMKRLVIACTVVALGISAGLLLAQTRRSFEKFTVEGQPIDKR